MHSSTNKMIFIFSYNLTKYSVTTCQSFVPQKYTESYFKNERREKHLGVQDLPPWPRGTRGVKW